VFCKAQFYIIDVQTIWILNTSKLVFLLSFIFRGMAEYFQIILSSQEWQSKAEWIFAKPTRIKHDAITYVSFICNILCLLNSFHAQILSSKIFFFIYRVFNELHVAVGDDFLGLCTKKYFYQNGSCSEWYGAEGFFLNYCKCAPVNCASNGCYMLHSLRKPLILPLKGRWCQHISFLSVVLHAYCSQPFSKVNTLRVPFFKTLHKYMSV